MEKLAYVIFQSKYCMPCPTTHKCNMNYMQLCLHKHLVSNCIHRSLVPNIALCAKCLSSSSLPHDVHVGAAFTLVWTTTVLPSEHPIYVTHSLTHSLTHSHTHSLTHILTHLLTHSLTHSVTHSLSHSLTHWVTHSLTCWLTHLHTHSLTLHFPYQNV